MRDLFKSLFHNAAENRLYFNFVNKYVNVVNEKNKTQNSDDEKEYKVTLQELAKSDI